jgi:hypothetical protein
VAKKKIKTTKVANEDGLEARLDTIVRLLEDLFILQAAKSQVATGSIQSVLGIRKARVSKIAKGVKQARKPGKKGVSSEER